MYILRKRYFGSIKGINFTARNDQSALNKATKMAEKLGWDEFNIEFINKNGERGRLDPWENGMGIDRVLFN